MQNIEKNINQTKYSLKNIRYYSAGIIFTFVTWIICSRYFSPAIIPYPWNVIKHLIFLVFNSHIITHLLLTLLRTILGFLLALFFGIIIGLLTGTNSNAEKTIHFPLILLQGCPPLLWIVPLLLILGPGGLGPIVIVYLVVLPVIVINIREARKKVPLKYFDALKIYADKRINQLKYIMIPQLSGTLKSVFLIGIVLAFKSSLLGEWFGAANGIGRMIYEYFYTYDMLSFYAVSLFYLLFLGLTVTVVNLCLNHFLNRKISGLNQNYHKKYNLNRFHNKIDLKNKTKIVLQNIAFAYPDRPQLFSRLTWQIDCRHPVIITGLSGTGKTTLAKLMAGILKPTAGSIYLPSAPCLIFQEDIFFNHYDCLENTSLAVRHKNKTIRQQKAIDILIRCGLEKHFNHFPDELSGGMKKKLAFARAMAANPEFIILDEPFINLDKKSRQELWLLFCQLFPQRKIPSIIITHYPEELGFTTEQVMNYRLQNGKIIKEQLKLKYQTIILN